MSDASGMSDFKSRLIALLRGASELQRVFVTGLSPEELDGTGTPARWSAKDLIAHLTAWKSRRLLQLEAVARGELAPTFPVQETNDRSWEELQRKPWADILAEEARVAVALVALINGMPEAELRAVGHYPSLPYQPAAMVAAGPAYAHVIQHLAEHAIEAGNIETAITLRLSAVMSLFNMLELSELLAAASYNLACLYAVTHQVERALQSLQAALILNPALAAAARDDTDFAPLRGNAEFEALVAAP